VRFSCAASLGDEGRARSVWYAPANSSLIAVRHAYATACRETFGTGSPRVVALDGFPYAICDNVNRLVAIGEPPATRAILPSCLQEYATGGAQWQLARSGFVLLSTLY
jgi:hypothetical protein